MKNYFLVLLTITTLNVCGQKHLIGVKSGISLTNVSATNFLSDNHNRTGFAIGLTYDYLFKKHFSTGVDIIYNQFGFTNDIIFTDNLGNPIGGKATSKFNYDYLSIPLKFGFNFGKTVYGFTNISLIPAFIADAKSITPTIDFNGAIIPGETYNVTNRVNKFDMGGLVEIGGGYKFKGRYWVYSSFSYQHGFTTITNSDYFSQSKVRHYGMTLNLGLKYALTKE